LTAPAPTLSPYTTLFRSMIEAGAVPEDLALENPVGALHEISHDPSLTTTVRLADGRQMTAVDLQREYLNAARKYVGTDTDGQTRSEEHTSELQSRFDLVC